VVAAVLAAGALIALPGCDWLSGSESGSRQSPFLSGLSINPSSVFCGKTFTISFNYDDPQADVTSVKVTLQRAGDSAVREESPPWPAEEVNRSAGAVVLGDFSFPCDSTAKGGNWAVTVSVEDLRGHKSNALTGTIRLSAPG
jgi:hypothetical protein